jgi:O-6-methylguanine DNA methyltransferase
LLSILYGETRTYADIARAVGRPQGFRAVGMAKNRNPVAIVVPCHRMIASDGTLCGYGGGLDLKRKLLEVEGALSAMLAAQQSLNFCNVGFVTFTMDSEDRTEYSPKQTPIWHWHTEIRLLTSFPVQNHNAQIRGIHS